MEKTAALNKLANAVREYVQAETQFNKIAQTSQQYAMEKNAQGILQRLGLGAKAAPKSNMGRNAALAALLLGGAGAGAYGMSGKDGALKSLIDVIPGLAGQAGHMMGQAGASENPMIKAMHDNLMALGGGIGDMASGVAGSIPTGTLEKLYAALSASPQSRIPDLQLKGTDSFADSFGQNLHNRLMGAVRPS